MNEDASGTGSPSSSAAAPAAAAAPRPHRLKRSRSQKVIGGVAGGLGDYFGVDPVVFRIGFVAATLLGGSGILLYVIAWLIIPQEGDDHSVGQAVVRRGASGRVLGIVLIVSAAVLLLHQTVHIGAGRFTMSLVLLAAGGALLFHGSGSEGGDGPTAPLGSPGGTPPPSTVNPPPSSPSPPSSLGSPPPPDLPAPRAPRSILGRATIGTALLVAGVMGLADASEAVDLSAEGYLVAALLVTGGGLIVGAWWGRSRWLIALGAVLVVALGAVTAFDVPIEGGFGQRIHIPDDLTEASLEEHLVAGEMRLDYGRVDFRGRTTEIEATIVFGELTVELPDDVRVIVEAEVDAGEVNVFGATDQGIDARVSRAQGPRGDGLVRVDLRVGGGEIRVVREEARHATS